MHDDVAKRTDPALWDSVKTRVMRGAKGGRPGQWSARKAQLAVAEYRKAGGGYAGPKSPRNHLAMWTREAWGTKSGRDSGETGERYLPKAARDALSADEHARTTAKKRADIRAGQQSSRQPAAIARKAAAARRGASEPKPAGGKATMKKAGTARPTASKPVTRKAPARGGATARKTAR